MVGSGDTALEWRLISATDSVRISSVYFETDGVPIAHWWMVSPRESVHFEAAAVPRAALGDTNLMLSVRASAHRLVDPPGEVVLEARIRTRPAGPATIPWDAEESRDFVEAWSGRFAFRNGRLVAGMDSTMVILPGAPDTSRPGHVHGIGPGRLSAQGRAALRRGERQHWDFWMPAYPSSQPGPSLERLASHEDVTQEARRYWRLRLREGATLTTPDERLNAAWRAALVTLLVCHERDGGEWVPIGNPFQYRDVWLRDAARQVRALAVAGHSEMARADAWTLRLFQLPSGVLISQHGQLDGVGQWLWTCAQAATLPPATDWAKRTLPVARRAFQWITLQRAITRQVEAPFPDLLPYGNPRDNELLRAQLVGNDAWGIAGCRATAVLARLAGDDSLAAAAEAEAADYVAVFGAALARWGGHDIPPSWQGPGRDWGNVAVGYPTCALPPDHPRLDSLARRIWRRAGGSGLANGGPVDTLHSYLGADLAQWALLAGRASEARACLAGMLDHASSTLGHAEVFDRKSGGFGGNLPPHTTAAAALVDLVRNMLICDLRDTLELALGGDPAWWAGTRLVGAPTRFGVIDMRLDSPARGKRRARWDALPVSVRIRVADGEQVTRVLTPGARPVGGTWVECPPHAGNVEFLVTPGRGAQEPAAIRGVPESPAAAPASRSASALFPIPLGALPAMPDSRNVLPAGAAAISDEDRAVYDSLRAAKGREDRPAAVFWVESLGRRHPVLAPLLLARALAWAELATARIGSTTERRRWLLRTSLRRQECLARSLALADSSARLADQRVDQVGALKFQGDVADTLGLPGDALVAYERIARTYPGHPAAHRLLALRALARERHHAEARPLRP